MMTSVVIPAYNGQKFLKENLPAVLKLKADEIVLVDDASTDDTNQFLRDNYPQIKLITHQKNQRFPISVNNGFAVSTGEIVILLNQDVKPQADLLKFALPHFKNPKVFAVTFSEQDRSWAKAEMKNGFLEFTNGSRDNQIHESFWASGGSAAFRKEYWDKLGGFDPIFTPGYYEDLDLGWRAQTAGYKILWDPKCKVEHITEATFSKTFDSRTLTQIKERNYLLVHWKNLHGKQFLEHFYFLVIRIIKAPGFIVPTWQAIWKKLVS